MRTCMSITRRAVWFHSELAMLMLAKILAADNLDTGTEIGVGFCYSRLLRLIFDYWDHMLRFGSFCGFFFFLMV